MRELYKNISKKINQLACSHIYPGFHTFPFALYNEEEVYLDNEVIKRDNQFIGNTAIPYNESFLAIWQIHSMDQDEDGLASKLVHEMFHAYQHEQQDNRWANEWEALRYDYNQLSSKYEETMLLKDAYTNKDQNAYIKFLSHRAVRSLSFPLETIYEAHTETMEGMALYVELKALQQLNMKKYNKTIDRLLRSLSKEDNYIPIRHISYTIGAVMMLVGEIFGITVKHPLAKAKKPITQLIMDQQKLVNIKMKTNDTTTMIVKKYKEDVDARIKFLQKEGKKVFITNPKIVGFDPLNTFQINDKIWFKYFMMLEVNSTPTPYLTEGVVTITNERIVKEMYSLP